MGRPVFVGEKVISKPNKMRSYANPNAYKSTPKREPKERHIPGWIIKLCLVVIALLFVTWFFFASSYFSVKTIQIKGRVSNQTKNAIAKLYGKNIFLIGGAKAEDNLTRQEPGIKRINILRGIPSTVIVDLIERRPAIVWKTQDKSFLVDKDGYVYRDSDGQYPLVVDDQNVPVRVGGRISTSTFIGFILGLNQKIKTTTGLTLDHIEVPETTYQIRVLTKGGPELKLDTSRSLTEQLKDIKYIIDNYSGQSKNMIDVRVPGFAYIK